MRVPGLLLCAGLGACTSPPADPRGVAKDEVLLQVSASGRADTRPDEARFTAGVQTIAATAAEASARNSATINKVIESLRRLGVTPDDVQTRSITLSRIGYGPNRGRFEANNMIEVKLRAMNRAGEAIAATTEAGANVLSGPSLALSDPEKASRTAYAAAYRAARARAEAYADAAGLKVARVLAIRDSAGGGHWDTVTMDASAPTVQAASAAPPPPPVFQPGMSRQQVAVRVDFALSK